MPVAMTTAPNRYVQILHVAAGVLVVMLQSAYFIIKSAYNRLIPQPAKCLQGQVVLVTGAGHGIGRELALEFWRHGCTIVCVDRDGSANNLTAMDINTRHQQKLESMGEVMKQESQTAYAYTCDVRDRNQVAELTNKVLQDVGHVDFLVNNAGIMPVQQTEVIDAVNVNLLSQFWTVLAFLPGMIKRKQGHIVAISSVSGLYGLANKVTHSPSKYAVTGFMEALSKELSLDSHNVKVTCAYPYSVNATADLAQQLDLRIPELTPEHAASEIVNAVRHNMQTITVPTSLLFWINVLRTLPQDARDVWRDLFHARAVPTGLPNSTTYYTQVPSKGIKT